MASLPLHGKVAVVPGATRVAGRDIAVALGEAGATETIEEAAEMVDQLNPHIGVLVNDICGAEVLEGGPPDWNRPLWEHKLDAELRILRLGIETHLVTSHRLLPLLTGRPGGLVVEVTDGTKLEPATPGFPSVPRAAGAANSSPPCGSSRTTWPRSSWGTESPRMPAILADRPWGHGRATAGGAARGVRSSSDDGGSIE